MAGTIDGKADRATSAGLARYRIDRPRVADELIGDELVVINFDTGKYHGIRGGGVAVWRLLDAGYCIDEMVAALSTRQARGGAATRTDVAQMIAAFVAELEKQRLIEREQGDVAVRTGAAMAAEVIDAEAAERLHFTPPEIDSRDDLADYLVLDPIHDVDERGWPHARTSD